jgi:hypothetical protein
MNALKHGLTAKTVVIPGESATEFEELRSAFLSAWNPVDTIEADLVGQFAISTWKMRRISRFEAERFSAVDVEGEVSLGLALKEIFDLRDDLRDEHGLSKKSPVPRVSYDFSFPYLDKLIQYGTTYECRYFRALHTLMQLRAARASEQPLSITPDETAAIEVHMLDSKAEENSENAVPPHMETSEH